jgi:hypothetical protein
MIAATKDLALVTEGDLERISANATELNAKAMLLTDAWGAMFILDPDAVKTTVTTLGMPQALGQKFYDKVRSVSVIDTWGMKNPPPDSRVFTWHMFACSILIVRGEVDLGQAMAWLDNDTLRAFVRANHDLLTRTMAIQPDYANYLLFSPQVAANVVGVFGARVDPDEMLRLANECGVVTAIDPEGRRGIACKFARSLALAIASKNAGAYIRTSKAA